MEMVLVAVSLLIWGWYGFLGSDGMRHVLSWFFGILFPGERFFGVGILKRGLNWPPRGTWNGQLGFLVIGAPKGYQCSGEWKRKGRVIVFWSTPKQSKQTKLRPDFSFG